MAEKEYIVTLKTKDDLNQFYIDMELKGYSCAVKRPLSRNTHYYLTEEQAKVVALPFAAFKDGIDKTISLATLI